MSKKKSPKTIRKRIVRHLREWHRKLGIIAAFFLIFLSISGIALNHTERLALAHLPIESTLLLDHYGIQAPKDLRFYLDNRLSVTNKTVWFDNIQLFESETDIVSAGLVGNDILVASQNQLSVFNSAGQLLDVLDQASGVPSEIRALHIQDNNIILNTNQGYVQTDDMFFEWQAVRTLAEPKWITPSNPNQQLKSAAVKRYRSQFLTLERIILDAHSGRIMGLFGVILMDIVAILLILLSVSGLIIWIRQARSKS